MFNVFNVFSVFSVFNVFNVFNAFNMFSVFNTLTCIRIRKTFAYNGAYIPTTRLVTIFCMIRSRHVALTIIAVDVIDTTLVTLSLSW